MRDLLLLAVHLPVTLAKLPRPGDSGTEGPSWLTFTGQIEDSLWNIDLFRRESILLRSHWLMWVMDTYTRQLVGFGVERTYIDGVSVCRMFDHAIAGQPLPKHASTDRDGNFMRLLAIALDHDAAYGKNSCGGAYGATRPHPARARY